MTDTTIKQHRNYHKLSTGILIAAIILLSLGGVASHFLKPTGYLAFEPIAFGGEKPQVDSSKLTDGQDKLANQKKLAEAQNPPVPKHNVSDVPERRPTAPPKTQ